MGLIMQLTGALLAIYLIRSLWQKLSVNMRTRRAMAEQGCRAAPSYFTLDPIFGLDGLYKLMKAQFDGNRAQVHYNLHRKIGQTFEMASPSGVVIRTAQSENLQAVGATKFKDWGVEALRGSLAAPFLDRGVFTDDGPFWKHSRAMIQPIFTHTAIADLENFESYVARFLKLIPRDGTTFDLQSLLKRLFLDTSTEFLFGKSTDCLRPDPPEDVREFMTAFDDALFGMIFRLIAGPFRPLLALDRTWERHYTKVHNFVDKQIDRAVARQLGLEKDVESHGKYILLDEIVKQNQDKYFLRNQIINIFFPARDTAALAFSNIFFELARHPDVWLRLREEALAVDAPLTFQLLKSLKYTKAVVNETLRLHMPAPRAQRTALRDTVLPVGGGPNNASPLFVPKGRHIDVDFSALHRDPAIWGADAHMFKPERWLGDRPLWESKWQYIPFFGGPRMCPAQQQALTQSYYLLVRMAREFETIENRDPVLEFVEMYRMTVESRNGVKIALTPASKK